MKYHNRLNLDFALLGSEEMTILIQTLFLILSRLSFQSNLSFANEEQRLDGGLFLEIARRVFCA